MNPVRTRIFALLLAAASTLPAIQAQTLESVFQNPPQEVRPVMIWEWMNGVVSREGITAELEAYKAAGIGGVQQFIVSGDMQILFNEPSNAIGTDNWRALMKYSMEECARLGLTFGTHNCPGWSSSAHPDIQPEYSMQALLWSETTATGNGREQAFSLPRPETDPRWDFYRDVAVVAVPAEGVIPQDRIRVFENALSDDGGFSWAVPDGDWVIYRFGHSSNGRDNHGTGPTGGIGLECDKMSKEAVEHFWALYPAEIIKLAGPLAGKTLRRFEVDSYEVGGQTWTAKYPEEFLQRCGYSILPWLPALAGRTIGGEAATRHFLRDYEDTGTSLVAENYYGHLSELAHRNGMVLLTEPYGTGGQPFNPIDTRKISAALAADDPIAAEFWTMPLNWGWPEVPSVVAAARAAGHETIWAEAFTSVSGQAFRDDPDAIKRVGDKAYCLGINGFMLHAAAQNPWPDVKPGMTFGSWGTQWTPTQTWWKDGAPALFAYFARCQALLQRGKYVDDFHSTHRSLESGRAALQWIHRQDGDTDLYFVANTADTPLQTVADIAGEGRVPELWNPENAAICDAPAWLGADGRTQVTLDLGPGQSLFIVFRRQAATQGPGLTLPSRGVLKTFAFKGPWTVRFPEGWDAPEEITLDRLASWHESPLDGVKYFSGTACYSTHLTMGKIDPRCQYILDLGDVKNVALVRINGQELPPLWRTPFRVDVSSLLQKGDNQVEIEVSNLWINRLIGDEQEPDDIRWEVRRGRPGLMLEEPDWLRNGTPRPSRGRKTVTSYKFVTKDDPLLPSGLLGPVVLEQVSR